MFSTKFTVAIVSGLAALSAVSANTGFAKHWDPKNQVGCGKVCPPTARAVALAIGQVPNAAQKCCHEADLSSFGNNIHAVFTHFYIGEPGSQNITVTDTTFQELAPGSTATAIPVVWNIN